MAGVFVACASHKTPRSSSQQRHARVGKTNARVRVCLPFRSVSKWRRSMDAANVITAVNVFAKPCVDCGLLTGNWCETLVANGAHVYRPEGGAGQWRVPAYQRRYTGHHYASGLSLPSYRTIRSTIRYTSTEDSNQSQSIPYRTTDHMHSTVFEYILTVQFKVPADPNH